MNTNNINNTAATSVNVIETVRNSVSNNFENFSKFYTHGGVFHADEVFSWAFIKMLRNNEGDFVIRISNRNQLPADIHNEGVLTFDIGLGDFDHHQSDAAARPNGIKYAAFGLIVRESGILNIPGFESWDNDFVMGIDAQDNGQSQDIYGKEVHSPVLQLINDFRPAWDAPMKEMNEAFKDAVAFATGVLERQFKKCLNKTRQKDCLDKAILENNGGVVVLEKFVPWQAYIKRDTAKAVIYPANGGNGYNCQVVPKPGELQATPDVCFDPDDVRSIPDVTFVHNSGFLIAANTLTACKEAAKTLNWVG